MVMVQHRLERVIVSHQCIHANIERAPVSHRCIQANIERAPVSHRCTYSHSDAGPCVASVHLVSHSAGSCVASMYSWIFKFRFANLSENNVTLEKLFLKQNPSKQSYFAKCMKTDFKVSQNCIRSVFQHGRFFHNN